jgi:thioesterase domain-containing protein
LFWIHGDSSTSYLADYLGPDQPLFGLEHQSQDGTPATYTQVETIAEHYLWQIRAVQPLGPYMLGGYSFGGTIAFEIALRLEKQGETVSLLAMLDAPFPDATAPPFKIRATRAASARTSRLSRNIASHIQDRASLGPMDRAKYIFGRIANRLHAMIGDNLRYHVNRLRCRIYARSAWRLPASLRSFYVLELYRVALRGYSPQAFAGRAVYFKSTDQSSVNQKPGRLMRDGLEVARCRAITWTS